MAETPAYNHTDIQRYLQHKMSQQEMHEFEKTLMNDSFLADAIEGFSASDMSMAAEHLVVIERSITANQQKAKVVPLPLQQTAWWKVAAIILVIISAGAITYSVLNNNSSFNKNNQPIAIAAPQPAVIEKDSIRPADKPVVRMYLSPEKHVLSYKNNKFSIIHPDTYVRIANQNKAIDAGNERADKIEKEEPAIALLAPATAATNSDIASPRQMKLQRSSAQNEFKGKVVEKSGEPLPFANIKANNSSIGTVADSNGNFSLKAPDRVLEININSPGYASAKAKIKSNKPVNRIVVRDEELTLAEVVVASKQKKKKNVMAFVQVDSSTAAEPIGGWKSFKQYLNRQLDSLKETGINQGFDEDIVLEFSLDKKGKPTNIKAPAEIDKIMAEKAIQILSNGPSWKNKKKDKKVKVIIAF